MSDQFIAQLNTKLPTGALVNLRADSVDEFNDLLGWAKENAQLLVDTDAALIAASNVAAGGLTVQQPQAVPAQSQGNDQPAAPQASGGGGTERTVQDRYGNSWTYGRPDAPSTPRGPAVLKSATSQAGRAYKRFEDPCKGPEWNGERKPADMFDGAFLRG